MKTALVTGASGFIGGHLCEELLRQGHRVRCLARRPDSMRQLQALGAEVHAGDVMDRAALLEAARGADVVYHLAGKVCSYTAEEMHQVNQHGTENLADVCAQQERPPVLVLVSSVAAAGPAPNGRLRDESQPEEPISHYGRSKLAGEAAVRKTADRVPTSIVRPGIVFGERDRALWRVFNSIRWLRAHFVPGVRPGPLSYIYVKDLTELLIRAGERGLRLKNDRPEQGVYFACQSEFPDYGELGRIVGQELGRKRTLLVRLPWPLPWIYGSISEAAGYVIGHPSMVNVDKIREAMQTSWACSNAASRRDLQFKASAPLRDQLSRTVKWYRDPDWA